MRTKLILLGFLTSSLQLSGSGLVARFQMATQHARKRDDGTWEERTAHHIVVVHGKDEIQRCRHLVEGSSVVVEGRVMTEYWLHPIDASDVLFLPARV